MKWIIMLFLLCLAVPAFAQVADVHILSTKRLSFSARVTNEHTFEDVNGPQAGSPHLRLAIPVAYTLPLPIPVAVVLTPSKAFDSDPCRLEYGITVTLFRQGVFLPGGYN